MIERQIFIVLLFIANHAYAETLSGKVVGVADGDTLTVLSPDKTQYKIRLAGIDAPEKKQDFGDRSKQSLSDCAFGKQVNVEWTKRDKYGRVVGKVLSGATDCNLRQLENGLAWYYKKYEKELAEIDRASYSAAEYRAKETLRGLWSQKDPVAPWDFRSAQ